MNLKNMTCLVSGVWLFLQSVTSAFARTLLTYVYTLWGDTVETDTCSIAVHMIQVDVNQRLIYRKVLENGLRSYF